MCMETIDEQKKGGWANDSKVIAQREEERVASSVATPEEQSPNQRCDKIFCQICQP